MTADPFTNSNNIAQALPEPVFKTGNSYNHDRPAELAHRKHLFRKKYENRNFTRSKISLFIQHMAFTLSGLGISAGLLLPGILFYPRGLLFVIYGAFSLLATTIISIQNFTSYLRHRSKYRVMNEP